MSDINILLSYSRYLYLLSTSSVKRSYLDSSNISDYQLEISRTMALYGATISRFEKIQNAILENIADDSLVNISF